MKSIFNFLFSGHQILSLKGKWGNLEVEMEIRSHLPPSHSNFFRLSSGSQDPKCDTGAHCYWKDPHHSLVCCFFARIPNAV